MQILDAVRRGNNLHGAVILGGRACRFTYDALRGGVEVMDPEAADPRAERPRDRNTRPLLGLSDDTRNDIARKAAEAWKARCRKRAGSGPA